jgi:hypothetical protein
VDEFPKPTKDEQHSKITLPLFDFVGVGDEENEESE